MAYVYYRYYKYFQEISLSIANRTPNKVHSSNKHRIIDTTRTNQLIKKQISKNLRFNYWPIEMVWRWNVGLSIWCWILWKKLKIYFFQFCAVYRIAESKKGWDKIVLRHYLLRFLFNWWWCMSSGGTQWLGFVLREQGNGQSWNWTNDYHVTSQILPAQRSTIEWCQWYHNSNSFFTDLPDGWNTNTDGVCLPKATINSILREIRFEYLYYVLYIW